MRSMTCCRRNTGSSTRAPAATAAGVFLLLLAACGPADHMSSSRYVPTDDNAVLVADTRTIGELSEAGALWRELAENPRDASLAARFTEDALRRYARTGDARLLGYAATALDPWSGNASPPRDIWLLRARLAQTHHEFRAAADDLAAFLKVYPGTTEALLLASDAARRAGDLATARRHCVGLQLAGHPTFARLCAADILLTLGKEDRALRIASNVSAVELSATWPQARAWAEAVHGDAALASGDHAAARAAYQRALQASDDAPLSLRISYIDLLLAQGDYEVADSLLRMQPDHDALLLRRAIAARRLGHPELGALQQELAQRFETATAGDPNAQLRERALYELHVALRPQRALELAERNWRLQKGWEDAALLQSAANAAGDDAALRRLRAWRDQQQVST